MVNQLTIFVKKFLIGLAVAIVVAISFFPIYWMFLTSIIPWQIVLTWPPKFIPTEVTFEYWEMALQKISLPLTNSLIIAGVTTLLSLLVGVPAGYSFARFRVGGPHIAFWILSIRFLPGIVPLVALYTLFRDLKLLDTQLAVIASHLIITVPFSVWMMRSFIEKIPVDLEEAALVDGCSRLRMLLTIILPLSAPGMVVTALFSFLWSWNEFLFALILTKSKAYTLPVMIASFRGAGVIWGGVSASALLSMMPALILAILLQRYLLTGLTFGTVKG